MAKDELKDANEPLRGLLHEWRVSAPLPPRFEEQVWRRIARAEDQAPVPWWMALFAWLQMPLPRPALSVAVLLIFLTTGLIMGYWQAENRSVQLNSTLSTRYVQSIDPYSFPKE